MNKRINVQKPYLGEEELKEVGKVFDSRWLGMGMYVKNFEEKAKKYLNAKNFVAVNTGTSAIHLALEAAGVKKGDEVIVPAMTFVGSIQPIIYCGGKPVFCEVDYNTINIDVKDAEKRITKRTKAIIPVHYSGLPCNMDDLLRLGRKYRITIIEDAAHAFGSSYKGKKIGSFGDLTCFSFDPIKNITCGEGGAVATKNSVWADKLMKMRLMGIDNDTLARYKNKRNWFYNVVSIGFRYHMSNINAAIGLVQMKRLNAIVSRKIKISKMYDTAFKNFKELEIIPKDYNETAPFNYIIKVKNKRDELINFLKEEGIDTGIHYIPNHIQPFFKKFRVKLPVTERLYNEILTLPLYFEMTDKEVSRVIKNLKKFFK